MSADDPTASDRPRATREEEWRPVEEFDGYEVSSLGRIRSRYGRGRKIGQPGSVWKGLKPNRKKCGHLYVFLYGGVRPKRLLVHHLVLIAFVGPCPDGMECRHLNGVPDDNRLDNLCWGTRETNLADRVRHGGGRQGEKHPLAKLTGSQILDIRRRKRNGEQTATVAKAFGISKGYVRSICGGQRWRHITDELPGGRP